MATKKSKKKSGPITNPVMIDLKDEQAAQRFVATTIDPSTKYHHLMCDICGSDIKLTTRGDPPNMYRHRDACKRDLG
jgi:hypothetical protein